MLIIRGSKLNSFRFVFLFFLISVSLGQASNDERQVLDKIERQEIVKNLKSLQKDIDSITAKVYQEKHISLLKKDIHIEGTVILHKPDMLRWETVSPDKSITVVDGKTMTVYHSDVNEAQVYNLSENFIARNTMNFFTSAMWGSLIEMEEKFTVNIFRKNSKIVFELIPLSKIVAGYLSSVVIFYNEKTGIPMGFEVTTPKGDRTVTELTDIKTNPAIKPDTFKINLPEDVWITNIFEEDDN